MATQDRIRRQYLLRQAEGYLELGMSRHALETLDKIGPAESLPGQACYLRGEALRALERYAEAILFFRRAVDAMPDKIAVWLALGWCYKRVGRVDQAIEALESALEQEPEDALVHYNLACYWSLAGNKRQALTFLARAINLDEEYRRRVAGEPDFDALRSDPSFQALVGSMS